MWSWLCMFTSFQKILLGFSPQLHMQSTSRRYLQVIPFWSAPLAPPTVTEKPISIGECWMVIGQCKKSARVWLVDQSHGPYISWCSHQNQHNLPCFGSSNSSVATFSGEFQYDMASKQPAVIKVPDDDFPNSGPQNPVEAQSYRDQLNCHNEHIQQPLDGRPGKMPWGPPSRHSRNWWWSTGDRWPKPMWMWSSNPFMTPTVSICGRTSPLKVLTWQSQQQMSLRGWTFLRQLPKKGMEDRGLGAHRVMLWPPFRSAHPHVIVHG